MTYYECIFDSQGNVHRYEHLRFISADVLYNCAKLILDQSTICYRGEYRRILDAGSGSGRFAFPIMKFAKEYGSRLFLVAVDLSFQMIQKLRDNHNSIIIPERINLIPIVADLRQRLPVKPSSISLAFTVATFHILDSWRIAADNIIESISSGGNFIVIQENNQFMHQTEGFTRDKDFPYLDEILSEFMQYYHWLRAKHEEPYEPKEIRYSDMTVLLDYLELLGLERCDANINRDTFKWYKPHNYADILYCFRHRQMTTWGSELKEETRQIIANALEHWVTERGINLEEEFLLPAELVPHIFVKVR